MIVILLLLIPALLPAEVRFPHGRSVRIAANTSTEIKRQNIAMLSQYVQRVTGSDPLITRTAPHAASIVLAVKTGSSTSLEGFSIATGPFGVTLTAATDRGLRRAVQRLIILSRQESGDLVIPDLTISSSPWIPEREWAVCPWTPREVRGAFLNPWADNRLNLFLFSDDQLRRYVEMYDWFGYSGVQLLETSYSYGVFGSPEAFQDKQRSIATKAKALQQNVSLWVWAAEFNSYGWTDPDVVYTPEPGRSTYDDPRVRRGFEKYYDLYARLAPYIDRLIGHFYDPGQLRDRQDVFRYMRLLEQKFKAKNPRIRMSIDSWAGGAAYLDELVKNGFSGYLLLEMSMPNLFKPGQREAFHQEAERLGVSIGIWGWYTTEYETDQLASMYVNAKVLANFYRQMRAGAARIQPLTYWSEMEAHHLNNIYSMYAAAQLLWDPQRDPHQILDELTTGIWGPAAGRKVLDAVELIQDVRSGETWDTYWWRMPAYRLGTPDAAHDRARADAALGALASLEPDPGFVPKFPLPVSPRTLIEVMLPHLRQIRAYAQFRIDLEELRREWKRGLAKEQLGRLLNEIWKPIPEYNTWVGTFGVPENRQQEAQLRAFAAEAGVPLTEPGWVRFRDADRMAQLLQNRQARSRDEVHFRVDQIHDFFWPPEKVRDRVELLQHFGMLESVDGATYRLANWRHFRAE